MQSAESRQILFVRHRIEPALELLFAAFEFGHRLTSPTQQVAPHLLWPGRALKPVCPGVGHPMRMRGLEEVTVISAYVVGRVRELSVIIVISQLKLHGLPARRQVR